MTSTLNKRYMEAIEKIIFPKIEVSECTIGLDLIKGRRSVTLH
jgi:hypothetical protein